MFTKPLVSLGTLALATVASAKPIPALKELLKKRGSEHSFNSYGGYDSMSHFDDFYGSNDYSGVSQTLVKEKEVVCHSVQVEIVQQHLSVIQEWYKKIITEQVCEVEVQTIVHEQFVSGCEGFSSDLRHKSGRDVSYDHNVASQITQIHDSNSNCVTNDLGWKGYDVGSHAISYSGDNWNSQYSPSSIDNVYNSCQQSYGYSSPSYSSSWSSSYSPPSYSGYHSSEYTPSYGSSEYSAPSYEAPTHTYDSSYGHGYDSSHNGYGYDSSHNSGYDSSYNSGYGSGYGSGYNSGYGSSYSPPSSVVVSSDGSSSGCSSCGSGSAPLVSGVLPSDSAALAALPTDSAALAMGAPNSAALAVPTDSAALAGAIGSSLATATNVASGPAPTDAAASASAAASAPPAAAPPAAASGAPAPGASATA